MLKCTDCINQGVFFALFIVKKRLFLFFCYYFHFCFASINRTATAVDVLYKFNLLTRRRPANTKGVHFSTICTNILILWCAHISFTFRSLQFSVYLWLYPFAWKSFKVTVKKNGNSQKILPMQMVIRRREKKVVHSSKWNPFGTHKRRQAIST